MISSKILAGTKKVWLAFENKLYELNRFSDENFELKRSLYLHGFIKTFDQLHLRFLLKHSLLKIIFQMV